MYEYWQDLKIKGGGEDPESSAQFMYSVLDIIPNFMHSVLYIIPNFMHSVPYIIQTISDIGRFSSLTVPFGSPLECYLNLLFSIKKQIMTMTHRHSLETSCRGLEGQVVHP